MANISAFNTLLTLTEANRILRDRLELLGERKDLHELRDIFDNYNISSKIGLSLLHRHYSINEGEMVVEFGHVSTPWPVPASGQVAGGYVVPRSWRFLDEKLVPYEFGFNHPSQAEYEEDEPPVEFVAEVGRFLTETNLADVLGICAIGAAETEGRIEMTRGRVSFTLPHRFEDQPPSEASEHATSVWSFDCKSGLQDSTLTLARACWVCPKH